MPLLVEVVGPTIVGLLAKQSLVATDSFVFPLLKSMPHVEKNTCRLSMINLYAP